jgi:hypothetical protein
MGVFVVQELKGVTKKEDSQKKLVATRKQEIAKKYVHPTTPPSDQLTPCGCTFRPLLSFNISPLDRFDRHLVTFTHPHRD